MWSIFRMLSFPFSWLIDIFAGSRGGGATSQARPVGVRRGPGKATLAARGQEDISDRLRQASSEQADYQGAEVAPWVVWDGCDVGMPIRNGTNVPRWYRLSVTDLAPSMYEIYEPTLGRLGPASRVRLDPGAAADLTVTLGQLTGTQPQVFHVFVTEFARDDEDAQKSVAEQRRCEWVPMPRANDMELEMSPDVVLLRPWHKHVQLDVAFTNRSYFPVSPVLTLTRQDFNGKPIDEVPLVIDAPEPVQPMHRERWSCKLDKDKHPGDPFVIDTSAAVDITVSGAEIARFDDIRPPDIAEVHWKPFLQVRSDWLLVFAGVFALLWLIWGIPVFWITPRVCATLNFDGAQAGQFPEGIDVKDVTVKLFQWDHRTGKYSETPIELKQDKGSQNPASFICIYQRKLRLFGVWVIWFGHDIWHPFSRRDNLFQYCLAVEGDKLKGMGFQMPCELKDKRFDSGDRRVFSWYWTSNVQVPVQFAKGVFLDLDFNLADAAKATASDTGIEVKVSYIADGKPEQQTVPVPIKDGKAMPIGRLRLSEKAVTNVSVAALASPSGTTAIPLYWPQLEPDPKPQPAHLRFSNEGATDVLVPGGSCGFGVVVKDLSAGGKLLANQHSGKDPLQPLPLHVSLSQKQVNVEVRVTPDDGRPAISKPATLEMGKPYQFPDWDQPAGMPPGVGGPPPFVGPGGGGGGPGGPPPPSEGAVVPEDYKEPPSGRPAH